MQPTHRQHALFFHKVLSGVLGLWINAYVCIVHFVHPTYSWAPALTGVVLLAVVGLSLLVGMSPRCPDRAYDLTLVVLTLLSAPIVALANPKVQLRFTLSLLGDDRQDVHGVTRHLDSDCSDNKTNGQYWFQWLVCAQALFLLRGKLLVSAPLSAITYNILVKQAGESVGPIDWFLILIPVSLSIGARLQMDRMWRRMESLVAELREQTQSATALLEENMAAREKAVLRGGLDEVSEGSLSLSLSESMEGRSHGSLEHPMQQGPKPHRQQPQHHQALSLPPLEGPLGAVTPRCHIDSFATPPVAKSSSHMSDCETQTDLVPGLDGFRCTRCSKPPPVPTCEPAEPAPVAPPPPSAQLKRWLEKHSAKTKRKLRYKGVPRTPEKTQCDTLEQCYGAWNLKLPMTRCCDTHALLVETMLVAKKLHTTAKCTRTEQQRVIYVCSTCGVVATDPENAFEDCLWCTDGFMVSIPPPTEDAADSSSSSSESSTSDCMRARL